MHDEWSHMLSPLSWQHPLLFLSLSTATLTNKYPAGELIFMSIVPEFHTHSLCKSLQPVVYNPYVSCLTQRVTFPHYLSRRMVSHTLMARKRSYGRSLMHSQTQWVFRTESHFLLGEVSHCNKAGRGSQGRISTPGRDKWSAVFFFFFFFLRVSPMLFFYFASAHQLWILSRGCFVSVVGPQNRCQFYGFTPQWHTLWLSAKAFVIGETFALIDKSKCCVEGVLQPWIWSGSLCYAKDMGALAAILHVWFAYWSSEKCLGWFRPGPTTDKLLYISVYHHSTATASYTIEVVMECN